MDINEIYPDCVYWYQVSMHCKPIGEGGYTAAKVRIPAKCKRVDYLDGMVLISFLNPGSGELELKRVFDSDLHEWPLYN